LPGSTDLERLRVVLVEARNPLNIGAAARAMSNFGVSHLRVVNPFQLAFREARSAVGAADLLARTEEFETVDQAVADCSLVVGTTAIRHRDVRHVVKRLDEGAGALIRERLQSGNVALLFGSEKFGLSNEDLSHCHWLLNIPTREGHISMNLGQAVAVCLYELIRSGTIAAAVESGKNATAEDVERITVILFESLRLSGYVKPRTEVSTEGKVRRLVRRLCLTSTDAITWLGMLRRISLKLKRDAKK
jgi:TrmH family RNA methyltransferase